MTAPDSFCRACGTRYVDRQVFCTGCGAPRSAPTAPAATADATADATATVRRTPGAPGRNLPTPPTVTGYVGRYPVSRVLGSGGFGTVHLGHDPATGGVVAIKVLDRLVAAEGFDEARVRLLQEADALRAVDSAWCVRVLEVVDQPGLLALVTDYIDGATLRAVLTTHGPLTGPQSLTALDGALRGLVAVHGRGLVHGDLKPENVMLTHAGTSRLIDFGIAGPPRPADEREWSPTGSPGYMSPEHVAGGVVDARSDLYACGVMLHELLTGRRPFTGDDVTDVLDQHVRATPADPRELVPDLGDALAALCLDALAKDPAARPQTAQEMLDRLHEAATERYGAGWRAAAGLGAAAAVAIGTSAVVGGFLGGTGAGASAAAAGAAGAAGGSSAVVAAGGSSAVASAVGAGSTAATTAAVSGGTTAATSAVTGGIAAKVAAVVVAASVVAGGGYAAVQVTRDDPAPTADAVAGAADSADTDSVAAADTGRDSYAYLTEDSELVVMNGATEVTRLPDATKPSWSVDGRYVTTVADGEVTLVDVDNGERSNTTCGCNLATIWGDRIAVLTEDGLVTYSLTDLGDDELLAEAPSGVTWTQLLPVADRLVALGDDGSGDGYRGGPMMVTSVISQDGEMTRIDDDVSVGYFAPRAASSPDSAYGGPRAAVVDVAGGGYCSTPSSIQVFDPADPGSILQTDDSAMLEGDEPGFSGQESHSITDLWFDGDGVLHASGESVVCETSDDFSGDIQRLAVPQQLWRLDGDTWVSDDERPLISSQVLPSGNRVEVARVTNAADEFVDSGILTLTDREGVTELADHVEGVFTPALKPGEPVAVRPAPPVVEVGPDNSDSGALIDADGDVSELDGLPADFSSYISDLAIATASTAASSGCTADQVVIGVDSYDSRGFARGFISACGGANQIWAKQDGRWIEAISTQDLWSCQELLDYSVPADLVAYSGPTQCSDPYDEATDDGQFSDTPTYYHPGPTVTGSAAGDDVEGSDGGTSYVTDCGSEPVFTPVAAYDTDDGVEITYEVTATCDEGQWLTDSQYRVPFVADGFTYADGYFDFSSLPQWLPPGTSTTTTLRYPNDVMPVPAETLQTAIDDDAGSGEVVRVPCEPGPDSAAGQAPDQLPADPVNPPLDAAGSPVEDGTIEETDEPVETLDALTRLRQIAADDYGTVDGLTWTTQLSSKRQGTRANGRVFDSYDAILRHVLRLKNRYPDALLAWSGDWPGSYDSVSRNYWIVLSGIDRGDRESALQWCVGEGIDRTNCWAKTLRTSGNPKSSLLKQPE